MAADRQIRLDCRGLEVVGVYSVEVALAFDAPFLLLVQQVVGGAFHLQNDETVKATGKCLLDADCVEQLVDLLPEVESQRQLLAYHHTHSSDEQSRLAE